MPWESPQQVDAELGELSSTSAKLQALKDQINIYVKGYGWVEFKTPFSCANDKSIGTVDNLTTALIRIIRDTRGRERPREAKLPATRSSKLGVLGTLTASARGLRENGWSTEDLRTKYAEVVAQMEAKRAAKDAASRDSHALAQPDESPVCDETLLGKLVEVMTRVGEERDLENGGVETVFYNQWLPARITRVADGSDTKPDKQGHQRKVKKGWFLLAYDDGESIWTRLTEDDFNCARIGSWRLDLDPTPEVGPVGEGGAEELQSGSEGNSDEEDNEDSCSDSSDELHSEREGGPESESD